jgi:hypothetical protein
MEIKLLVENIKEVVLEFMGGTFRLGVRDVREDFAFAFEDRKYVVSGEELAGLLDPVLTKNGLDPVHGGSPSPNANVLPVVAVLTLAELAVDDTVAAHEGGATTHELGSNLDFGTIRIKAKRQRSEAERIGEVSRYRWSSLSGYLDGKRKAVWMTYDAVGSVGGLRQKNSAFVQEGIRQGFAAPWEGLVAQMVLGNPKILKYKKKIIGRK